MGSELEVLDENVDISINWHFVLPVFEHDQALVMVLCEIVQESCDYLTISILF